MSHENPEKTKEKSLELSGVEWSVLLELLSEQISKYEAIEEDTEELKSLKEKIEKMLGE